MHRRAYVPISLNGSHYGLLLETKALAKIVNDAVIIGAIGYLIPPKRHHVANTFKAEGDHVRGLREPFSRPRFHPLIVRQTDISAQE